MGKFKPSKFQQRIFDFIEHESGSCVIQAVAGSGKTTTIVDALEMIPDNLYTTFLAFNRAIADELRTRVPKHVRAATFHSQGMGAWIKYCKGKPEVDENKSARLFRGMLEQKFPPENAANDDQRNFLNDTYFSFVCKMVSLAKGAGVGYLIPDTPDTWFDLMEHFDVQVESDNGDDAEGIELAREILRRSNAVGKKIMDYDDMIFLPLINNVRFWRNDYLFVDESQDVNAVQLALLKRMLKPGGRLVAVGDSAQAIYGFRGADSNAMARIVEEFDAVELPLSVSYRCSKNVVRFARDFVEHIEPHYGAPDGVVGNLGDEYKLTMFQQTDGIICRNTAPLIELAFALIRERVPCKVMGRDIGRGLVSLIKKMAVKSIDHLIDRLDGWRSREIAKLESKGREDRAQVIDDKHASIMAVIEHLDENNRTIPKLISEIERMFTDNGADKLTLATIHKSKGLEWNRVFILGFEELQPSPWARKSWHKIQETNLQYVAITRAKMDLFVIAQQPKGD